MGEVVRKISLGKLSFYPRACIWIERGLPFFSDDREQKKVARGMRAIGGNIFVRGL